MRDVEFTLFPVGEAAPIRLFGVDINPESPELKERDLLSKMDPRWKWKIQKKLSGSDVDANTCRLLLPKADVEAHILPLLDDPVQPLRGFLPVRVVDDDNDVVYGGMKLTFYKDGSCVLNGRWTQVCNNNDLQNNDKVGLYWDRYKKEFRFAVLDRAVGV